jgi:hypothetical protein
LHDELPYELAVEPETWEDFKDGSARIGQVIFIQRESQKPIVLGRSATATSGWTTTCSDGLRLCSRLDAANRRWQAR